MASKVSSTFCASISTRTNFLHGARFSTVTFTNEPFGQRVGNGRRSQGGRQVREKHGGRHHSCWFFARFGAAESQDCFPCPTLCERKYCWWRTTRNCWSCFA